VDFSRRVYGVIVALIIAVAGVSGLVSTRQSRDLLDRSLDIEGRAVADALARAAFVPLTLENRPTMQALAESYRGMEGVAAVRILDNKGALIQEASFSPGERVRTLSSDIRPPVEPGEAAGPTIGRVEVDLSEERVRRLSAKIARLNMAVAASLAGLISVVAWFLVRTLVVRMRELVGEAQLVAQVRQANAELEAFSYSVSHDLRAPLRGVAGFALILQKRLGSTLAPENREHLDRVIAGAKRMGEIIDDLLTLSRVSRRELVRTRVDLSAAAREVLAELREREPGRAVRVFVADGLSAQADPTLVRTVLENLLSNAWKYTSKTGEPRIEVGARLKDGRRAFFVRDNGAGFEMAHAANLFKPFQRLHAESDFEGTGIGLATVERIVRRHGGRVWAEAEPGRGATFYFTLHGERAGDR
jgi:signal transduction histidine kinase